MVNSLTGISEIMEHLEIEEEHFHNLVINFVGHLREKGMMELRSPVSKMIEIIYKISFQISGMLVFYFKTTCLPYRYYLGTASFIL